MKTFVKNHKSLLKAILLAVLGISCFYVSFAFAQDSGLSGIASSVRGTFVSFAKLITAASYLAGLGFVFVSILEFKKHRDNPTSNPLGKPVAYLFVGIALLFLPYFAQQAGQTIFKGGTAGTISGESGIN